MSSIEASKEFFKKFLEETEVELMPNTGFDYEEQLDKDEEALNNYVESKLFSLVCTKIK